MTPQLTQARRRNRMRWIVRIGVAVLAVVVILFLTAAYLLQPTTLSPEAAAAAFAQLGEKPTREEAERLLGKPKHSGGWKWEFVRHNLLDSDVFECAIVWNPDGTIAYKAGVSDSVEGTAVWRWRWTLLKEKFGISLW